MTVSSPSLFFSHCRIRLPEMSPPVGRSGRKSCMVSFQSKFVATSTISATGRPLATKAPISAPMLVPATALTGMPSSASTWSTPIWARPRAPPPPKARTIPANFSPLPPVPSLHLARASPWRAALADPQPRKTIGLPWPQERQDARRRGRRETSHGGPSWVPSPERTETYGRHSLWACLRIPDAERGPTARALGNRQLPGLQGRRRWEPRGFQDCLPVKGLPRHEGFGESVELLAVRTQESHRLL